MDKIKETGLSLDTKTMSMANIFLKFDKSKTNASKNLEKLFNDLKQTAFRK